MKRKKIKKYKWLKWVSLLIVLLIGGMQISKFLVSTELQVTFTHLYSPKIVKGDTVRVIAITDLHNQEFGENNQELVETVRRLKPDIIAMAGDIVNKDNPDVSVALNLCRSLKEIAPVYYSLGNHEGSLIYVEGVPLDEQLRAEGIHVLVSSAERLDIRGSSFVIGGIEAENEDSYKEYAEEFINEYVKNTDFKLLLSHFPQIYYDVLQEADIDLGICGHFHGGQIRLPILGGVYSVEEGLFPRYCSGLYGLDKGYIYVSRGLGNNSKIPRIYNRPELAVIDINGRKATQ